PERGDEDDGGGRAWKEGHESLERAAESDRDGGEAEHAGGHPQPANGEADHRPESVERVDERSAAAVVHARQFREAERDQDAENAAEQDAGHAGRPAHLRERRDQQIDAAADDAVDADADRVEQRQFSPRFSQWSHASNEPIVPKTMPTPTP